jgi:hypothetical protein
LAKGATLQPAGAAEKRRARKTDHRQAQQGVSVAELAAREGVTLRRMQNPRAGDPPQMRAFTAGRIPGATSQPPQRGDVRRLRLDGGGQLKAVDRVVRIVSEMDRYYGFFPRRTRVRRDWRRLVLPAQEPPVLAQPAEAGRDGKMEKLKSCCN